MTKQEVVSLVYKGDLVKCTIIEYEDYVRRYLQEYASECVDNGDYIRATIALNEVRRLDRQFDL